LAVARTERIHIRNAIDKEKDSQLLNWHADKTEK
jgi:hypothetical protein